MENIDKYKNLIKSLFNLYDEDDSDDSLLNYLINYWVSRHVNFIEEFDKLGNKL